MVLKSNINMNKLFISCLSIFALCSGSFSQTYIYDKNLKVPLQIMLELRIVQASKVYSSSQVISEFMSNEIRATELFSNKPLVIGGRIAKIYNVDSLNIISLQVGDDETSDKYLSIAINNKDLSYDKIQNYSVGDWINVHSFGFVKSQNFSYEYIFQGVILHSKELSPPKKNHLVKILNIPNETTISFENDESQWVQKFSDVVNGKSYCKLFNFYGFTVLNVTFKNKDGKVIKNAKLSAKLNCHSIFDYNKL